MYYEKFDKATNKPVNPKGHMELKGAEILPSHEPSEKIYISGADGVADLEIDCGDTVKAQIWTRVIAQNIAFVDADTSEDILRYSSRKHYN